MRSIREIFTFYFVDWHRRVDAAWGIEMISGTLALLLVLLTLFSRRPGMREEYIPWLIGFGFLAGVQLIGAVIGSRVLRGFGCLCALVLWSALSYTLWQNEGFSAFHAGPLSVAIASLATCMAYHVSSKPPSSQLR